MSKLSRKSGNDYQQQFEKFQEFCSQQYEFQQQALFKKCPECSGKLVPADIMSVGCKKCGKTFLSQTIVKGA